MGRRGFLRAAGIAAATPLVASGAAGAATAQDNSYARKMVFPRVERFSKDYVGRFIILSDPLQKEPNAEAINGCDFVDWSPERTDVYEALIVDRHQTQEAVTLQELYVKAGTEYAPGSLFIVGQQSTCPQDYVGVLANSVPDERLPPIDNESRQTVAGGGNGTGTEARTGTTAVQQGGVLSSGGSGFGPLAALSGVAGTAWHLLRDDGD